MQNNQLNELIEKLTNNLSTQEFGPIFDYLTRSQYDKAYKEIVKTLPSNEATQLVQLFEQRNNSQFILKEISTMDMKHSDDPGAPEEAYLVRVGFLMDRSHVITIDEQYIVIIQGEFYPLNEIHQVWIIEVQ